MHGWRRTVGAATIRSIVSHLRWSPICVALLSQFLWFVRMPCKLVVLTVKSNYCTGSMISIVSILRVIQTLVIFWKFGLIMDLRTRTVNSCKRSSGPLHMVLPLWFSVAYGSAPLVVLCILLCRYGCGPESHDVEQDGPFEPYMCARRIYNLNGQLAKQA